jgi:hypothetical protein
MLISGAVAAETRAALVGDRGFSGVDRFLHIGNVIGRQREDSPDRLQLRVAPIRGIECAISGYFCGSG